jgi:beta-lactamase regulating signal transducer with metallopeptidase domain
MSTLLSIGIANALVSAILGLGTYAVTRVCNNPHVARALWLVVLLKLITPPLFSFSLPDWTATNGVDRATEVAPRSDAPDSFPTAPERSVHEMATDATPSKEIAGPQTSRDVVTPGPSIRSASPASTSWSFDTWATYLGVLWLSGSLACGLVAWARIVRFHRLLKSARTADTEVQEIGEAVAKRLGMRRNPPIRIADAQLSPMVWPIGSPPTVILPQALVDELEPEQLRTILAHEFGHIARGDCCVRWLEVMCTVLYWWNPCLWLARRELRAAEELGTDALVVASYPGCSRAFGESLLKVSEFLSGIPFRAPVLVSEMRGSGHLERRISTIIDGCVPPRLPTSARFALLIVAAMVLPLSAQEAPGEKEAEVVPVNEELDTPTLAQAVQGLKAHEGAIKSLVVTCRVESLNNFTKPGAKPSAEFPIEDDAVSMTRDGTISWELTSDGRGRMTANLAKSTIRYDGSKVDKTEEIVSAFDGEKGQFLTVIKTPEGVTTQRHQRPTSTFMKVAGSPLDFTTQHLGKPISSLLSAGKLIGNEEWEDRPVIVIEAPPVIVRDDYIYKQQFWIDVDRGFTVVRRQSHVQRGKDKPWGLHYQVDATEHREVQPGFWLPSVVEISNYLVGETGQDFQVSHDHIRATEWKLNEELDSSRFALPSETIDNLGAPIVAAAKSGEGERPSSDAATNKEDAATGFREMLVKTVDEGGSPVSGVRIFANILPDGPNAPSKRNYKSDDEGQVSVLVPSRPQLVRIWTQKEGFVPLFAQWWPEHQPDGGQLPKEFTFSLPAGTEIGGLVVDDDGSPIKDAIVEVALGNRVDEIGKRPVPSMWLAEVPGPGSNPCMTGVDGRWTLDNVPAGDEIFVRVKLTHPDYVNDKRWGGLQEEQAVSMKAFREKSAKIRMHGGAVLAGQITDDDGRPVPDAVVVWGNDPYFEEGTQEVRADKDGKYRLLPLSPGKVNVTVMAEGWSPTSKTVTLTTPGSSEEFKLAKGNPLRIRFVDEDGNAIPNVAVSIRSWRGVKSLYNHVHPNVLDTHIPTTADAKGLYTWDWAPHDEVNYSFYKDGYQPLDRALAANGDEHVVKMVKVAR